MLRVIRLVDGFLREGLARVCSVLLLLMVVFTCYTVVMRTVFQDPPFWGDTMALFANVWLVMLAFALSIRERSSISMQMLYNYLPEGTVAALELLWTVLFIAVGAFMAIYGYQVASRIPGTYWELDNLPKSVPMIILPVSGVLVGLAALFVLIEDLRDPAGARLRADGGPTESG
jgi:TRAP-type C4-dicarboxylate transport system permease small subunit